MAYRIGYRNTQGQQGQGVTGGGYLLDQYKGSWLTQASGTFASTTVLTLGSWIIPQQDTIDFNSSVLGDYEPISVPYHPRVGRVQFAFAISIASVASTSSPILTLNRFRGEPASAPTSVSTVAIATYDLSAHTISLAFVPQGVSGSLISNGVLNAGDVLALQVSAASNSVSLPAGNVLIDIEA